jgi:signal peptide peptidase SppA
MQSCDLWVMEENALRQMKALLALVTDETIERAYLALERVREFGAAHRTEKAPSSKSLAVLPVHGPLEPRPTLMGQYLGMTSCEAIGNTLDRLVGDETVSAVVMDFMTPGGMVYGVPELAQKIYEARSVKPIIGVSNPLAASGGQWLISACSRCVGGSSSDWGSVGVIVSRFDATQQMDREGIKEHVIRSTASPYKGEFVESEPMTDEARQHLQLRADAIYEQFSGDVARFRGVSVEHVNESFGKGRLVDVKSAVKVGLADRVMTLQETVGKLAAGRIRIASAAAQDDWNAPTQTEAQRMRVQGMRERVGGLQAGI